jgi:hypothetical protein
LGGSMLFPPKADSTSDLLAIPINALRICRVAKPVQFLIPMPLYKR